MSRRIRAVLLGLLLLAGMLSAFGAAAGLRIRHERLAPTPTPWAAPAVSTPTPTPAPTSGWWREIPTPWRTR